ncbi:MAG TPA: hypothetical protein VKX25_02830 [Bryobacteraceae bacterium]|jgi:hypothetical protein|nr:hypothetical protein [Bryobacteraceae bacterium]
MALFTDPDIVTLDDLLPFEASLGQVASSHGIDVDGKIAVAMNAIGDRLMLWLLNAGASDPQWLTRRVLGLSTVVVTSALHRWICFESLARVFAEAYNVQLNTRYQGKWNEYQQQAKNAANLFFLAGVGIVYAPLPKPALPLVSVQSGTTPAQTIFVQTAWVDSSGNESALSDANAISMPNSSSIAVAMNEGALQAPSAAVGWNIYAGTAAQTLSRQNMAPLVIGAAWDMPASGLISGAQPINGQMPSFYIALANEIRRG